MLCLQMKSSRGWGQSHRRQTGPKRSICSTPHPGKWWLQQMRRMSGSRRKLALARCSWTGLQLTAGASVVLCPSHQGQRTLGARPTGAPLPGLTAVALKAFHVKCCCFPAHGRPVMAGLFALWQLFLQWKPPVPGPTIHVGGFPTAPLSGHDRCCWCSGSTTRESGLSCQRTRSSWASTCAIPKWQPRTPGCT